MSIAGTVAKNSAFVFIASASDIVTSFVAGIALARYLGAEQYGIYSLMVWFLSLATTVIDLGIADMAKRFIAEAVGQRNPRTVKGLVKLTLVIRGSVTLLASLLTIILSGYFARLFNVPADGTYYFILIAGVLFPYMLTATMDSIFAGFQKYEYSTYIGITVGLLRTVPAIILVISGFGVSEILISYMGASVIGLLMGLFFLSRLLPLRDLSLPSLLEPATQKTALKYSLAAMFIIGVDYFLWQQAEVFFLGIYRPVEEVGFYRMAHRIPAMVISLVPFVLGRVLLPAVSEQFGKGNMEKIKLIFTTAGRYLMMLSLPVAAAGISLARPLINILFGSEYMPAIALMQVVFIPFAMRGITHAVSSIIYGIKEPAFLLKIGLVLICLSIGLNLWLTPKYGAMGAVIATSIPRMLSIPVYILFVSKKIKASWPIGDTARIVLASIGVGLVVFMVQYFLSDAHGLWLGVLAGIVVYIAEILFFGLIKPQDLRMLTKFEKKVPSKFKNNYVRVVNFISRFVKEE